MQLHQTPSYEKVLQELVMDILRVLSSPGLDVRQKTLSLCLDLVSSRNVEDMVMFLKKEIAKSTSEPAEEAGKYRQALVKTLHSATIKFPDGAASIVPVLMEFLSDENETAAQYVLLFVREAVHKLPHLKETILHSLEEGLLSIRKPKVFMAALWILGTYCEIDAALLAVLRLIISSLGELPIVYSEMRLMEGEEPTHEENSEKKPSTKQLVTADGTYATQSAFSVASKTLNHERPPLRQFLLDGDFFLGASLATVLNKLVDQFSKNNAENPQRSNRFRAECMFILASIINFGKSGLAKQNITEDDLDRMGTVIKLLAQGCSQIDDMFVEKCKDSLELMLNSCQQDKTDEISTKKNIIEVDKTSIFTQLSARADAGIGENLFDLSLSQALGTAPRTQKFDFSSSKLGKVVQLAGFSDPMYAEAYVNVNQYDIVLDLSTVRDLELVDKPTPITLAPSDFTNIKATVKVASTGNDVIFSTISYDVRGSTSNRNCLYLQDIKIDIM
ncbi:hypothetical protein KIN20_001439 [Parelaphostrongylus tenuis]|uniref:Coatomer subunit beta n=1 Tax=Parelaphostrongylus tenuis TaxID=148309 RepID=A0AAD5LYC4_PARTN|nr:hypothetical protein KIN20_001439 [Parelaphostrongylus tenuis]